MKLGDEGSLSGSGRRGQGDLRSEEEGGEIKTYKMKNTPTEHGSRQICEKTERR